MKTIQVIFRKLKRDDHGQALIELALSIPLLMMLLLGATELGRLAYAAIEVSNAAKAAAQFASYGGAYSATSNSGFDELGMKAAARADAAELGNSVDFTSGYPIMSATCSGGATASYGQGNVPPTCSSTKSNPNPTLVVTVAVKIQTSYNPLIFIPGWSHGSITLYGWAQQTVLPL